MENTYLFLLNLVFMAVVVFYPIISRKLSWFELPVVVMLPCFFTQGLFNLRYFIIGSTPILKLGNDLRWLNIALLSLTVSYVFLWFGYFSRFPGKLLNAIKLFGVISKWEPSVGGIRYSIIVLLLGASIVARNILIKTGYYGYLMLSDSAKYLHPLSYMEILNLSGSFLGTCLVLLCGLWFFVKRTTASKYALLFVLVVDTYFRILSGFKGDAVINILLLGVLSYLISGKGIIKYLSFGFLFLILLIPVNLIYRTRVLHGDVTDMSFTGLSSVLFSCMKSVFDKSEDSNTKLLHVGEPSTIPDNSLKRFPLINSFSFLSTRLSELIYPAALMKYYHDDPNAHFWLGREYLMLPVLFIPRILWPSKPVINKGLWMTQVVLGCPGEVSWAPPTTFGEFYLNFGLVGSFVCMFLYGIMLRIFHLLFFEGKNPIKLLYYVIIILTFTRNFNPDVIKAVIEMLIILAVVQNAVLITRAPVPVKNLS